VDDQPGRTMDYDPMVYDVMRETAARLRGAYIARERAAGTEADQQRWAQANLDVWTEVEAVDVYDEDAVRAKTAELRERLRPLLDEPLPEDVARAAEWDRLSDEKKALAAALAAAMNRGDVAEVERLREQWFTVDVMERCDRDG